MITHLNSMKLNGNIRGRHYYDQTQGVSKTSFNRFNMNSTNTPLSLNAKIVSEFILRPITIGSLFEVTEMIVDLTPRKLSNWLGPQDKNQQLPPNEIAKVVLSDRTQPCNATITMQRSLFDNFKPKVRYNFY